MRTIIGSFERVCVLVILFQLYGSKAVLFEGNYSGLVSVTPNIHIGRSANPILI